VKIYASKSAKDISVGMLINFILTSALWIGYGLLTRSMAVVVTNVLLCIFSFWIFVLKRRYD